VSRTRKGADRHLRSQRWLSVSPGILGIDAERELWGMILWVAVGHFDIRVAVALVGARTTLAAVSAALRRSTWRR
jgi:hypothetical protein